MKTLVRITLVVVALLSWSSRVQSQSCITKDEVSAMVARVKSPDPKVTPNKKLSEELIKLHAKDQRLLRQRCLTLEEERVGE